MFSQRIIGKLSVALCRTIFEVVVAIVLLMVIIGKNNDIDCISLMAFKARIPVALDSVGTQSKLEPSRWFLLQGLY